MRKTLLSSVFMAVLAIVPFTAQANTAAPMAAPGAAPMPGTMAAPASAGAPMAMGQAMINLNTADAATLQKELAGIGAAKAKAIVAFREQNGAFTSVEELLEVDGIGKALLDRNRARLAVN
jgi:competence protein ComEA